MEIYGANPVDIVVLIVLLVSGLLALVRGFVSEVLTLAGLVIAVAVALYALPYVEPHLVPYLKGFAEKESTLKLLSRATAATGIFFTTLITCSFITYLISRKIHKTNLSAIDRSFGFLFGLVRGMLIVTLLYIAITAVFTPPKAGEEPQPGTMQAVLAGARSGPALDSLAKLLSSFAPKEGLTIEELTTNVEPLRDLIQPQVAPHPVRTDENRGYGQPARESLNDVINRASQPEPQGNGQ